jgi:hypothetical protein
MGIILIVILVLLLIGVLPTWNHSRSWGTLTWFCGNNQGDQRQRVSLTFKKINNTWVLDKTDIGGGNCS